MNAAFTNVSGRLYPIVGLGYSCTIKANFGATEFKWKPGNTRDFDIDTVHEEAAVTDEQAAQAPATNGHGETN